MKPDREMWADFYKFYAKACETPPSTPAWTALGYESQTLIAKHGGNWFVRDVLSLILSYRMLEANPD